MVCVRRAVDEIEEMTETLRLYFSEGLHKNMFHKDFQMQIKGIDVLLNDGMTLADLNTGVYQYHCLVASERTTRV